MRSQPSHPLSSTSQHQVCPPHTHSEGDFCHTGHYTLGHSRQYIPIILKAAVGFIIRKLKVFTNRYLHKFLFRYSTDNSIIRIIVSTITLKCCSSCATTPFCYHLVLYYHLVFCRFKCPITFAIVCVYTERLQGDVQQNKLSSGADCILIALS